MTSARGSTAAMDQNDPYGPEKEVEDEIVSKDQVALDIPADVLEEALVCQGPTPINTQRSPPVAASETKSGNMTSNQVLLIISLVNRMHYKLNFFF